MAQNSSQVLNLTDLRDRLVTQKVDAKRDFGSFKEGEEKWKV
jgi:hypothetical protein